MSDLYLPPPRNWNNPALDSLSRVGLFKRDAKLSYVILKARGRLVYLATPYSKLAVNDSGEWCRVGSYEAAVRAALWAGLLAAEGITAVSPIVQSVEMVHSDLCGDLNPLDEVFWEGWCRPLLAASDVIVVPPIPGWRESEGIWIEVCSALSTNRPVYLIDESEGLL